LRDTEYVYSKVQASKVKSSPNKFSITFKHWEVYLCVGDDWSL